MTLSDFHEVALAYCDWAMSEPTDEKREVLAVIDHLSALIYHAVRLENSHCGEDYGNEFDASKEERRSVFKRMAILPFNYYRCFSSPHDLEDKEPCIGDLADDLEDIYADVKRGLLLYQAGHLAEAAWQWKFPFETHWGEHATNALNALWVYVGDKGVK